MSDLRIRDSIITISTVWGRTFLDAIIAPRRFRSVMPQMRQLSDMLHHPGIQSIEVSALPAPETPIQMLSIAPGHGGMPAQDIYALLRVVRWIKPKVIFEIGTYQGVTTAHLALNSDAQIHTLDHPREMATNLKSYTPIDAAAVQVRDQIGRFYRQSNQAGRIHQLFGDSRTFDYQAYYGSADLVLVDACHLYDYVISDSHQAARLLGPRGVIVWHDFGNSCDMVRALKQVSRELTVYHVAGSAIAFHPRGVSWIGETPSESKEIVGNMLAQ
jgi:predicted O-methyltransferase YrrM